MGFGGLVRFLGVMIMRLIDGDELKSKLTALIAIYESRMPKWSPNDPHTSGKDAAMKWGAKADGVGKALELLERMPTIEAEPTSFGCSTCKHRTNCKDREKCGRKNGSEYEPCKPSPSKEEKLARLTKFSEIIEHYGSEAQLGKLMLASAHLLIEAGKCLERGIEISDELNEHAAEVVALIMQIYTHAPLYWIGELEKAIDEIIDRETKKIEVENEKNT